MSSDYGVLIESNDSLEVVKQQLEQIINVPLQLVEDWEHYDLYSVELMGLWIQLSEFRKLNGLGDDEFSIYKYQIHVGFLGRLIDPENGRAWTHAACVELARMFTKNMKCNTVVVKNYVVTHKFLTDTKKVFGEIVKGTSIDAQTRCEHYHKDIDIIALKFKCCGEWFSCFLCHKIYAWHEPQVWSKNERDVKAVLCGNCGHQMAIEEYMNCDSKCPKCAAAFNPGCALHYDLYFEV